MAKAKQKEDMSKLSDWSEGIAKAQDERSGRLKGMSGIIRFIGWLNNEFNPNHDWFDYSSLNDRWGSIRNQITQEGLTGAQQQANAFSANEAQKQRDWETEMSNTAFQRQVADMRAAGVNPAMAMNGSSGASTPSGSAPSSVSSGVGVSFQDIIQLMMLPLQKKLLASQAKLAEDQGRAALENAAANSRNAGTNEQNAQTQRFDAETRRMMKDIEERKTGIYESLTDEQKKEIAERAAYIKLQREQLPEQLKVAQRNASSSERQALAALEQAHAATQNAATNDRLADYETSLKYAQEQLYWYDSEGRQIVNKYLDARQRQELDNLVKEGVRLDKQGKLIDKTGHYLDSQQVRNYVESACALSNAVNKWVNPLSGMSSAMPSDWTLSNSVAPGAGLVMTGGF